LVASHTGGFFVYSRHSVGLLWTSDPPIAKAYTYSGQHNTVEGKHPCLKRDCNPRSQVHRLVLWTEHVSQIAFVLPTFSSEERNTSSFRNFVSFSEY
jgi:hypothetical protein